MCKYFCFPRFCCMPWTHQYIGDCLQWVKVNFQFYVLFNGPYEDLTYFIKGLAAYIYMQMKSKECMAT